MRKILPPPDEFYVGYLPEAPNTTATFLKNVVIGIGIVIAILALILVLYQKKFSTNHFEFGINTTVQGYLYTDQVPRIRVPLGKDFHGQEIYQTMLLVGFGKFGASEAIAQLEQSTGVSLHGRFVALTGSLIYGDGKALLQIIPQDNPAERLLAAGTSPMGHEETLVLQSKGETLLPGEVVDSKCFFGVMKPGEGKPHRSCAVRCIAGGIPPILKVKQANNKTAYYLILAEDYTMVNQEILPIVGQPVRLKGRVIQMEDWNLLLVNRQSLLSVTSQVNEWPGLLALDKRFTLCQSE